MLVMSLQKTQSLSCTPVTVMYVRYCPVFPFFFCSWHCIVCISIVNAPVDMTSDSPDCSQLNPAHSHCSMASTRAYEMLNSKRRKITLDDFLLSDLEEAEFAYLAEQGATGLAKIFYRIVKADIKVVDVKKNDCYIWNESKALWDERHCLFAQNELANRLTPVFDAMDSRRNARLHAQLDEITEQLAKPGIFEAELARLSARQNTLKKELQTSPWAKQRTAVLRTAKMTAIFKSAKTMLVDGDFRRSINQIPYLIPVQNRMVVDLRDGSVGPRCREHRFTFECPVDYRPADLMLATPEVDRFVTALMCGDQEMVRFMQRMLGYCITGEMDDCSIYFWYGSGRNGKGTLAKLLNLVASDFFVTTARGVIFKAGSKVSAKAATPHLIPLVTARIGMCADSDVDDKLNEGLLTTWCSNKHAIIARQIYGSPFSFKPQSKLVIQTNHFPEFRSDSAVTKRLKTVVFNARFTATGEKPGETKADARFIEELQTVHLGQFFRWLVRGAIEWYETKDLEVPKASKHRD
jgi:P4 family phage/plasmid primase-like protien